MYRETVGHFESKDCLAEVCELIADCIIYYMVTIHFRHTLVIDKAKNTSVNRFHQKIYELQKFLD